MRVVSEDHILAILAEHFPNTHDSLALARGDDCALLREVGPLCVSSDFFIENTHFRRSYFTPQEIGHKALAVNISDIAAMGARPLAFSLCLALPPDTDTHWLNALCAGMAALARQHDIALAGGDISRAQQVSLAITIWGTSEHGFLRRGSVCTGDALILIGNIGLARVGLTVLEAEGRAAFASWPDACIAHLMPAPKVSAGLALARLAAQHRNSLTPSVILPIALMDISDGLARDVPRLLGWTENTRRYGADIMIDISMLHTEIQNYAHIHSLDPICLAFDGGEDYALLAACPPDLVPALLSSVPEMRHIGTVTESGMVRCNGIVVTNKGFDHFA